MLVKISISNVKHLANEDMDVATPSVMSREIGREKAEFDGRWG